MAASLELPVLAYIGQTVGFYPTGGSASLTYRTLVAEGSLWDNGVGSAANGHRQIKLDDDVYHALGVQGFNADGTLAENTYIGQFLVLDPARASDLISRYDSRLKVAEYDSDVSRRASEQGWRAGIATFDEFIDYVAGRQQAATPVAGVSAEASKALFYMQWVSGLWTYGNPTQPNLPGCVMDNEITGAIDPDAATVRTYLESPIGCCTDYTVLLSMLLTAAGIEARVVSGAGHVFTEAFIDGAWWTLDANLNLAYRAAWNEVLNRGAAIEVLRFEHEGMREGSDIYSEALVDFYQYHMAQIEIGSFSQPHRWDAAAFSETLPYAQALAEGLHTTGWTGSDGSWTGHVLSAEPWIAGDFNGDGRADLATTASGQSTVRVALSDGDGLLAPAAWATNVSRGSNEWLVGDFTGEGRDDIFSYRPGVAGSTVHTSTGTAFATGFAGVVADSGAIGWHVGDFNGDGRDDVLRMVNGVTGAEVHLSNGGGFAPGGGWTAAGSGSQRWYVGDFNGDGRDDIAGFWPGGQTVVLLSTGAAFNFTGAWTTAGQGSHARWYVGDYNNDGRDDLGRYLDGVGFQALPSNGTSFGGPVLLAAGLSADGRNLHVGDFTGDGGAEVLYTETLFNGGAPRPLTEQRDSNGFATDDLTTLLVRGVMRLAQHEIDSPVAAEAAQQGWRPGLSSMGALEAYVDGRFAAQANAEYLAPFASDVARILFFAQWYGGLWKPGDVSGEDPQSVVDNDVTGAVAPENVSLATFLTSPVGSAADAAALLAATLTRRDIVNSIVATGDYVINEFLANGQWWSVNAELGVAFGGRWHDVVNTASEPATYVFDMAATTAGASTFLAEASEAQRDFITETGAGLLYDFDRYGGGEWLAEQPYGDLFADAFARLDATVASPGWASPARGGYAWSFGDFDGDARTDIFSYRPGVSGALVQLSTDAGFAAGASWTGAGNGAIGWTVGDFNGDGRDDIMRLTPGVSGADVFLSNGAAFVASGSWTMAGSGAQRWYVADFSGDGRDDLLRYVNGVSGAQVFVSNGSSFAFAGSWTPAGQGSWNSWFIGDYDGDGRDDLGRALAGSGFQAMLSTGSGFLNPVTWTTAVQTGAGLRVADIDGDGRDDLVVLGSSSRVLLSTGSGFAETPWDLPTGSSPAWISGDFDGGGGADFFSFPKTGAPTMYLSAPVDLVAHIDATPAAREVFDISRATGSGVISGFETTGSSADQLRVSGAIAASFASMMATGEQTGVDTVFDLGLGQTLILKETLFAAFTQDNFLFV